MGFFAVGEKPHILIDYSFLSAARGLNLIALRDGIKPETIPTKVANIIEIQGIQFGITEMLESA